MTPEEQYSAELDQIVAACRARMKTEVPDTTYSAVRMMSPALELAYRIAAVETLTWLHDHGMLNEAAS